jgi:hypothetical protein
MAGDIVASRACVQSLSQVGVSPDIVATSDPLDYPSMTNMLSNCICKWQDLNCICN